jgi:hypothetical protein
MKAWRAGALGRLRSEPFGDRLFRLRGFSRRPRLGVGKPALQDLVLGLQGFNVGFEDVQKRRIIRVDGRGAGRKCGHAKRPEDCRLAMPASIAATTVA